MNLSNTKFLLTDAIILKKTPFMWIICDVCNHDIDT